MKTLLLCTAAAVWPEWKAGSEFKAARDATAAQRK